MSPLPADEAGGGDVWSAVVTSRVLAWTAAVVGLAAAVVLVFWLATGGDLDVVVILLVLVAVAFFCGAAARVVVTIGADGLVAASALFGFRWADYALDDIADARVDRVSVGSWGGWGWRIAMGGSALILSGDRGLIVELVTGRDFTLTMPDPEWALAALLAAADARGGTGEGSLDRP